MTTEDHAATPLDLLPLSARLARMNARDAAVPALVAAAADQVAALVDRAVAVLRGGGRVMYLGAGSAGRIAAQDAAEVGPTYGVEGAFVAVVAGGADALRDAAEGLEDDEEAAAADLDAAGLRPGDVLVAVSASGSTPYTRAGAAHARRRGATTAAVVCTAGSPIAHEADLAVVVPVGPEVVEGSTRLTAGTAQKLVLNQLSTLAMVELGHVYGNLMIGVRAENAKLRARAHRAVAAASGRPDAEVDAALTAAQGQARVALVLLRLDVDAEAARERLAASGGDVRAALGERASAARLHTDPRAGRATGTAVGSTSAARRSPPGSSTCVGSSPPASRSAHRRPPTSSTGPWPTSWPVCGRRPARPSAWPPPGWSTPRTASSPPSTSVGWADPCATTSPRCSATPWWW